MTTITNNNTSSFIPLKQQQLPSHQLDCSDTGSDDQDEVYYSDASIHSSDTFNCKDHVANVESLVTSWNILKKDNMSCDTNIHSDAVLNEESFEPNSTLHFGQPGQQQSRHSPTPTPHVDYTSMDSDSSSAYSNQSESMDNNDLFYLDQQGTLDNQIHGDTSISATFDTTTIHSLSGNDDIRNMSFVSLSSSFSGHSSLGGVNDLFLEHSAQPTDTRATTPISYEEWDLKLNTGHSFPPQQQGTSFIIDNHKYILGDNPNAGDSIYHPDQPIEHSNATSLSNTVCHFGATSASDLHEVSLLEEESATANTISTLGSAKPSPSIMEMNSNTSSDIINMNTPPSPSPPKHEQTIQPSSTSASPVTIPSTITMSPSKSSITTRRIVSGLWSPFKSATKSSSKKVTRPSANFAERQKRQSRPPSCVLPGFQESLMEQFNVGNSKRLNLKHQQNLPLINTANIKDDYDWDFWTSVICNHDQALKNKDLSSQIHKGIPPSLRGTVWQLLSNSTQLAFMKEHHYMDLLRTTSPYDRMIQRDLARTFPNHKYFKEKDGVGQEALYNVVRAYSIHDPEVGYCQGLAFIVGPLLLNMPDEEAICVLIRLMSDYGLRTHFTPNMEGLHLRLYQFESLVAEYLPHISRHLKQHEINPTMFASQWFMTLFAYKFPLDLVFRIYDMVFVEGLDTVLLKFALALLKRNESHLLELDFEPLLNFLKTDLFEEYKDNEQQLIQDTNDWDISRKRLTQLEKEHKVLAAIEEQDAKVLESLQKHQATLRLQVDQLNQSSGVTQKEYQDVQSQLQDSQHLRQQMMDEQGSLKTMVDSLKTETTALPLKVEASFKTEFDNLCNENTRLTQRNAQLEDQLAAMESLLINIKMRYAQSQDEGDDLSKRLFELKKVIS